VILVVDHYDSFTFNLVQLIESLGERTEVVKSDAESAERLLERKPSAVVLSPGPGRPEDAGCFPELLEILPHETPVLGVCLGHQALGISAARYHSLVVRRVGLPDGLALTAWSDDGLVMATRDRTRPRFGVQFHPESILTPDGPKIIRNFLALTR
jgi:anthranilate synthase component 2